MQIQHGYAEYGETMAPISRAILVLADYLMLFHCPS